MEALRFPSDYDGIIAGAPVNDRTHKLSPPQIRAARTIYSPAINPRTNLEIFPSLQPGSELGWGGLAGPQPADEAVEFFKNVVFKDPSWNYHALTFDIAADLSDKAAARILNVTDPDLRPFFRKGGKLLMYQGWSDQLVAPVNTINYYNSVVHKLADAQRAASAVRLFMVPGMNHCTQGKARTPSTP